jgi:hypothetical protein
VIEPGDYPRLFLCALVLGPLFLTVLFSGRKSRASAPVEAPTSEPDKPARRSQAVRT